MSTDQNTDQSSEFEAIERRIAGKLCQKLEAFMIAAIKDQDPRSSFHTHDLDLTYEDRGFLARLILDLAELSNGQDLCSMIDGRGSFKGASLDARFGLVIHLDLNSPGNNKSFSVTQVGYLYGITKLIADGKMSLSSIEALSASRLYPAYLGHILWCVFLFSDWQKTVSKDLTKIML